MLLALPSFGRSWLPVRVDLAYSTATTAEESQFVVAGPGCLDGMSKCFTDTGGLSPAEVIGGSPTAP